MKYLLIAFLLIILFHFKNTQKSEEAFSVKLHAKTQYQTDTKAEAFSVLTEKCNVCHATKKRTDIFTLENMDSLAADIHKQVFVKRKMPKGRKIKLTEGESKALRKWLAVVLKEGESIKNEKSR